MCERRMPEDHSPQQARLLLHVEAFQAGFHALRTAQDDATQMRLRAQIQQHATAIAEELEPGLIKIASKLRYITTARTLRAARAESDTYQEVTLALARSLFFHILDQLPDLRVDPERNLRALLLTIAWNKQLSEERRMYGRSWSHDDQGPSEVSLQVEFFTDAGEPITHEPNDPRAEAEFADAEAQIDGRELADRIQSFGERWLSPEDQRVVAARLFQSPPAPFAEIAAQLGPGWSEATVRQRYRRALKRIREHLEGGL